MSTGQWGWDAMLPDDQVVRKQRFQVDHPEVEIINPANAAGRWVALIQGQVVASEFELIRLLDDLEDLVQQG